MDRFLAFGFTPLDQQTKEELSQLNSKLTPHLIRYQGMGWYDILVEHEKGYAIVSMGGENGFSAEDNEKKYIAIGDDDQFKSADDLLKSIGRGPWHEIVSEEHFGHGTVQQVKKVYPDL